MKGAAAVAALTLGVALVLFGRSAWGGHFVADDTVMRDTYHVSAILDTWGGHVARGHVPLWLPEFAGGAPAYATWIYGMLSPATLLWAVLPAGAAWTWSAILHMVLAASGLHLLLRARGLRPEAAASGALLLAFSGYVVGRTTGGHLNLVWPLAWTPWVLLGIERVVRGARGGVLCLAAVSALALLSGHVQSWFWLGPLCVVVAVAATRRTQAPSDGQRDGQRDGPRGATLRVAAAACLAVLLASIQWLPTAEYASLAARADAGPHFASEWSAAPWVLAEHVAPGLLGVRPGTRWAPGDFENESVMAGGLALLLLVGMGTRRGRRVWVAAALVGLVASLGAHTAITAWLHQVPPLSWSRVPGRALVLPSLAFPVLAAYGIDDALSADAAVRRAAWQRGIVVAVIVGGACVAALRVWASGLPWPMAGGLGPLPLSEAWSATAVPALTRSVLGLMCVVVGLHLGLRARHASQKRVAVLVVPAAALIAALLVAPAVRSVPDAFYRDSGAAAVPTELRGHRVMLLDQRVPYPEKDGVATLRTLSHVGTRTAHRVLLAPASVMRAAYAVAGGLSAPGLPPGPPLDLAARVRFSRAPGAVPERARVYAGAEPGATEDAAYAGLVSRVDGLWIHSGASAGAPGTAGTAATAGTPGTRLAGASAEIVGTADPCEVVARVESPAPGWLLLSEATYPGWETEDGGEVVRANVNFRAVAVPAGSSRVVLRFRPLPFRLGALIAAVALLGACVLFVRDRGR